MSGILDRGRRAVELRQVALQALVPPGGRVIEVGGAASDGLGHLATLVGPGGSVVSFEGDDEEATRLRVIAAVAGGHVEVVAHDLVTEGRPPVLDELLAAAEPLDLVLTRCNGADHLAVDALGALLDRWRPTLIVDFCPDAIDRLGDDPEAVVAYYRALGYAVDVLGMYDVGAASSPAEITRAAVYAEGAAATLRLRPTGSAPTPRPAPMAVHDLSARAATRAEVEAVPFWFHSVDLGHGVRAPGHKTRSILTREWDVMDLGDLSGRTVLDIGAWDGFFSFQCEAAGASEVVALDEYVWRIDRGTGETSSDGLPGRVGFDTARRLRGSAVRPEVADIATADLAHLGSFDVVLFLGVLYHLVDPLGVLRRVAGLTEGYCVIETQAIVAPGADGLRLWEFHPGAELNNDPTNWFVPTMAALQGACHAAGFGHVEVLQGPPPGRPGAEPLQYRAIVRAWAR